MGDSTCPVCARPSERKLYCYQCLPPLGEWADKAAYKKAYRRLDHISGRHAASKRGELERVQGVRSVREPHRPMATVRPSCCLECLGELNARTSRQLFCSERCADAAKLKRRPTRPCAQCGHDFHIRTGTKRGEQRYCSYSCKARGEAEERGPVLSAATPISYYSCTLCRTAHVMDARKTPKKHKPPCCQHLCACGDKRYRGDFYKCWACQYRYNKDSYVDGAHRRRARMAEVESDTGISTTAVAKRDGWRCHLCGKKVRRNAKGRSPLSPSLDHLVPISKGGTHTWANVALAHYRCNLSKNVKPMGEQLRLVG